jgi:hypothetical protein
MSILQLPFTLEGVSDAPSAKALGKLSRKYERNGVEDGELD